MHATARTSIFALALAACVTDDPGIRPPDGGADGDADSAGPYDDVELARVLETDEVSGEVHVVRDELGIPHLHAENRADLFFVQGYLAAHDRLPQMDVLRRVGAGTLSELYGTATLSQDLEMRMHMMKPLAEQALEELRSSGDPLDESIVEMLERYAAGVNAYAAELAEGEASVHPAIEETWDPERFAPWTAADSLVLGRFMAFGLSYFAPREIEHSRVFEGVFDTFGAPSGDDEALAARAGAHADLARLAPIGRVPTVDGVPGVESRDGEGAPPAVSTAPRARPSRELLERALATFESSQLPPGLDASSFLGPAIGSNSWAVGPSATGGPAILAGDQHLQLPNPSIFYPAHLIVPGELDVEGVTFPGIPGIILGHNGEVAWSSTTVPHDVTDVYLESIVPCSDDSGADCVLFQGDEVPIETRTETVRIGALGTITETREVSFEMVPHHGPIIPTIEGGEIVPREGDEALSVRYTGYEVTHEIRAFYDLMTVDSVQAALDATRSFEFGAQNFVIIDNDGNIGWGVHADIPVRSLEAHSFHVTDNPTGIAPWMILPGDGSAEWEGFLDDAYIPRVENPASGYLVTANSDPVGTTFDGDPLSGPEVEGRPLYLNALYSAGLRTARITARLLERLDADEPVTVEDMIDAQHDTLSTFGERMKPSMDEAFRLLAEDAQDDRSADVEAYVETLSAARLELMREAAAIIAEWTLQTPPAVEGGPGAQEINDSVATTLFNAWMHFFIVRALDDEYEAAGVGGALAVPEELASRAAVAIMTESDSLVSPNAEETQQPILCDDMGTADVVESCDRIALEALELAVQWAQSEEGFDTDDVLAWRWGERHTLTLEPLIPNPQLELGPFARAGDNAVVNVSPSSFRDLSMHQRPAGPAQRFIAYAEPGDTLRAKFQLPGGVIYDPRSPHYRDLLDDTYLPEVHAGFPYTREEVVAAGNERWLIRP